MVGYANFCATSHYFVYLPVIAGDYSIVRELASDLTILYRLPSQKISMIPYWM